MRDFINDFFNNLSFIASLITPFAFIYFFHKATVLISILAVIWFVSIFTSYRNMKKIDLSTHKLFWVYIAYAGFWGDVYTNIHDFLIKEKKTNEHPNKPPNIDNTEDSDKN